MATLSPPANGGIALVFQSSCLVAAVAELGSLDGYTIGTHESQDCSDY